MASFTPIGVDAQVKNFSGFMGNLGKMDKSKHAKALAKLRDILEI